MTREELLNLGSSAASFAGNPLVGFGINLLGGALLGDGPEAPDFVGESLGAGRTAQRRLDQRSKRELEMAEEEAAARGVTGTGAASMREGIHDATLNASADLSGQIADDVSRARNRQQAAQFGIDAGRHQGRVRGLSGLTQSLATNRLLEQYLGKQGEGMTGEDGEPDLLPLPTNDYTLSGPDLNQVEAGLTSPSPEPLAGSPLSDDPFDILAMLRNNPSALPRRF